MTKAHSDSIRVPIFADFNYYLPPVGGPGAPSTDDLALIIGAKDQDTRRLPVYDVRGREDELSLDTNGFCYVRHQSKLDAIDFNYDEKIEGVYYGEVEELLKGLW
jgi:hypothetical protein